MSKKLLSLALAVVMLISMFAFTVSAAGEVADGCKIGFYVTTDAYVGMPADEYVTFSFYYSVPDDLDLDTYRHNYGNIPVAFTDAFKLDTTSTLNGADAREFGSSYVDFYKESSKVTLNASAKVIATFNEQDATKNWTTGIYVQQTAEGSSYTTSTGYPIDPECEVFTLRFKTTREVKDTDSIGVPVGAYGGTYFKMKYTESLKGKDYAAAEVDFSNNVAYPEVKVAEPAVKLTGTMGQMKNWANGTFPFNAGIVGEISNLALTFDGDNQCVQLDAIVVSITTADGKTTANAYQVYKVDDTTWKFRAVIPNLDATKVQNTDNMACTVTIYVDHDNDDTTDAKTYTSEVYNTNLNKIYTDACTNYEASK